MESPQIKESWEQAKPYPPLLSPGPSSTHEPGRLPSFDS
jgi:hypothetical protein